MYDVIILGAGAAGLSAALWCDELGMKTLVLECEAEIGGQLSRIYNQIENHLGTITAQNGKEMRDIFARQIAKRNFQLQTNIKIESLKAAEKKIFLRNNKSISASALILATGVRRRTLNIPGENEFLGHGILESGKRDVANVTGKNVCIIGGGDAAAENALILSETANKVYLIHRGRELRARSEFLEIIKSNPKIDLLTETHITKISGKRIVEAVECENSSNQSFQLEVQAVLIRIGVEPNTELFRDQIQTDKNGYIKINSNCETSLQNVFAIGDVANPLSPTISSAVGMGATAAKVLIAKLKL